MRLPTIMTPEEIILEIKSLRDEIEIKSVRIHTLAQTLYQRVRRAPADDTTAIYMTYANAWTRFAGMVSQGSARTASISKVLRRLPPKASQAEEPKKEVVAKATNAEEASPAEALITMYDEGPSELAPNEAES
jgi:hypothetical protein